MFIVWEKRAEVDSPNEKEDANIDDSTNEVISFSLMEHTFLQGVPLN